MTLAGQSRSPMPETFQRYLLENVIGQKQTFHLQQFADGRGLTLMDAIKLIINKALDDNFCSDLYMGDWQHYNCFATKKHPFPISFGREGNQ